MIENISGFPITPQAARAVTLPTKETPLPFIVKTESASIEMPPAEAQLQVQAQAPPASPDEMASSHVSDHPEIGNGLPHPYTRANVDSPESAPTILARM